MIGLVTVLQRDTKTTMRKALILAYSPLYPFGKNAGIALDRIQYTKKGLQQIKNATMSSPMKIAILRLRFTLCVGRVTAPNLLLQKYFLVAKNVYVMTEMGNKKPRIDVIMLKPTL